MLAGDELSTDPIDTIVYQAIRSWTSDIPGEIVIFMFTAEDMFTGEDGTKKLLLKTVDANSMSDQIGAAVKALVADRKAKRIPLSMSYWAPWEGYEEPVHVDGSKIVALGGGA